MTFTMKEIVIFCLCLIAVPGLSARTEIQQLESFTTGGILIFCKYADQYNDKEKYFCKGNNKTCHLKRFAHNYNGRVFLYNNVQRDSLTVLITHLTSKDPGNYHCGVENRGLHTSLFLKIKEGDCCDSPSTTIGHEGRHVKIQCKYPEESNINITYFCKQHEKFIEQDLINLKQLQNNTKYSLTDNKNGNVFTVTIHDLERKDAGIYWCGVRTGGDNVALTRQVNLQITERQIIQIEGFTRGGIVILCQFDDQDQHNQRYFCKGNATTCIYNRLTHDSDSRFNQHENVVWNSLTVVITNLTSDDAGTYHCVEDGKLHTEFHLSIEEGDCCDLPIEKTGEKGGHVSIQCGYSVEFTDHTKHFCKEHEGCKKLEILDSKPKANHKYSLSDNKSENIFTVTIHDLEGKDAGIYWCGVQPGGSYTVLLRKVELQVSDGKTIPVQNTHHTAVFVLTVALLLIVALVLAVAYFLGYRPRQSGKQDRSTIVIFHKPENPDPDGIYEEIDDIGPPPPLTRCNYTKVDNAGDPTYYTIQSPPNLPDDTGHILPKTSHTQINTVYATVELPTIPGNVPTYSNIQSPIHTSADTHLSTGTDEIDSTVSTVYTTAQCPNNPSGIPTRCTDNPDPTNPANQEPKYTNEDKVCKTPQSPTHTSDKSDYYMVCSPTSTQVNMVYVNAELITNNSGTMCAEKVPSKPINSELTVQVEPSYPGISAVCIPSGTTHTDLHTTQLPSYKNDDDPVNTNFQVPINPDNELTQPLNP
ncbi:polymeric immunoglobulin receptor-like [Alosa pseudoharengus]|uniref:polymeric immunoglobulin receptor-like n=1 Tax=Alosa pseudoharengus TaxID=34774 RepID=UPI003F8BBA34